jgi:peptide/nickel transport system substrate-binding protein
VRVDPRTNRVDLRLPVGGVPHGLVAAGGNLWLTAAAAEVSHRGGTLTVLGSVEPTIDPAVQYTALLRLTNDGLVTVRPAAGAAGTALVPDLAAAIPTPVDGGRTYAFHLRKGIRYSTGAPVLASDFRRAVERQFRVTEAARPDYYAGIRGTAACAKVPTTCDLSRGIVADDATGALTFHLDAPDGEFLYKLSLTFAAPVPQDTPDHDIGTSPAPATGPYRIARFVPSTLVEFVRNPHFREWSRAAQPDGYPDRIVFRQSGDAGDLDQVLSGKADLLVGPPSQRMPELITRYPAQLHRSLGPFLFHMAFKTTAAPFNDRQARQALSYAVDQRQLVEALGGAKAAQGTCQILPPTFPGYAPYCPYRRDTARAHRLVAQSGTAGRPVTVVVPRFAKDVGPYFVKVLRSLGYRARLSVLADDHYFDTVYGPHPPGELVFNGWGPDYPAASSYIDPVAGCPDPAPSKNSTNIGRFCDRTVQAQIQEALALQQTEPAEAGRRWKQIDRALVDRAAVLPMAFAVDLVVTSRRTGNYVYQPGYGVLLDQLWVR